MKKTLHSIGFALVGLFSRLPMSVLYVFSDFNYYLLRYLVRYRLKVVRKNVSNSFPELTAKERRTLINKFYRYFSDYIVETLKLLTISAEEMRRRLVFSGCEEVERQVRTHGPAFVYLGHFGNWEWISSLGLWLSPEAHPAQLYKPLRSTFAEELFRRIRTRFSSENIDKNTAFRRILQMKKDGTKAVIGFIADQRPKRVDIHDWITFLNQDTPLFTGAERIGKKLDSCFFYLSVSLLSRGHYKAEFVPMVESSAGVPDWQLSEDFMRRLEADIRRQPHIWLWTHNRWKIKKPQ